MNEATKNPWVVHDLGFPVQRARPRRWAPFRDTSHTFKEEGFWAAIRVMFTPPRKLKLTKAGRLYFLFMLIIVGLAFGTSNNLLFLLFAAMLSSVVASGILSERALRDLRVGRSFPDSVYAMEDAPVLYSVTNQAKRFPAFSIEIIEGEITQVGDEPPMIVMVGPGETSSNTGCLRFERRGEAQLGELALRTEYPFMLFQKTKMEDARQRVVVFPPLVKVDLDLEAVLAAAQESGAEGQGDGDLVSHVREWEEGEPLRNIDWKKSARLNRFIARAFQQQTRAQVLVRFTPTGKTYEPGLALAAGLLRELDAGGVRYALQAGNYFSRVGAGQGHLEQLQMTLALFEQFNDQAATSPIHLSTVIEVHDTGRYHIIRQ